MSTHHNIRLTAKLYYYAAVVTDVYDGDTMTVDLDLGLGIWRHEQKIRLWRVDTPEVRGESRQEGIRVRDMVRDLVLNKRVLLRTILDKRGQDRTGKYGRLLGEVLVPNERGALINVNDLLLGLGLATPMGQDGSRQPTAQARGAAMTQPIPSTISCPFCGETRRVLPKTDAKKPVDSQTVETITTHSDDTTTAEQATTGTDEPTNQPMNTQFTVEQCPNCLDEARSLSDF